MTKVIYQFVSREGPVRVEVEERPGQGPVAVGQGDDLVQEVAQSFEDVLAGIRPIADGILSQITALAQAPQGVEVSFGIKVTAAAGVILASTSAEGHVTLKLSWAREKDG